MGSLRVAQGKYAEALALLTPIEGAVKAIPGTVGLLRRGLLLGLLGKAESRQGGEAAGDQKSAQ